jgi:2-phospho-L-lactate guanylyltransferase
VTADQTTELSRLHVLVPVRGLTDGKARLGFALDAEERETLVVGLLVNTLDVLAAWPDCEQAHVVSAEPGILQLALHRGAGAVADAAESNLNAALIRAREAAVAAGATAVLCLPSDLPFLSTAALERLLDAADAALAAGNGRPLVVIAPADARDGTNALLLAPPHVIEPRFGEQSLAAHVHAAGTADASLQLVVDADLGFDLDTPDDLERIDTARLVELLELGAAHVSDAAPLSAEPLSAEAR